MSGHVQGTRTKNDDQWGPTTTWQATQHRKSLYWDFGKRHVWARRVFCVRGASENNKQRRKPASGESGFPWPRAGQGTRQQTTSGDQPLHGTPRAHRIFIILGSWQVPRWVGNACAHDGGVCRAGGKEATNHFRLKSQREFACGQRVGLGTLLAKLRDAETNLRQHRLRRRGNQVRGLCAFTSIPSATSIFCVDGTDWGASLCWCAHRCHPGGTVRKVSTLSSTRPRPIRPPWP